MATVTGTKSATATLTTTTVDDVSLDGGQEVRGTLLVTNISGASNIAFSIDGATPVVGGGDDWEVPAGATLPFHFGIAAVDIKVVGNGNEYLFQLV